MKRHREKGTERLMNEAEFAARVRVSPRTMRTLRQSGVVPYIRIGKQIRYTERNLSTFIARQSREPMKAQAA